MTPRSIRPAYRIGWAGRETRSEKRETDNGTRDGTGGDAWDASSQPETAEAKRRWDGEAMGQERPRYSPSRAIPKSRKILKD